MNTFDSYKNLVELIEIHENLLSTYRYNLRLICAYQIKMGAPAEYRSSTSYLDADCIHGGKPESHEKEWNKLVEESCKLKDLIEQEELLLSGYKSVKEKIDSKLKKLSGLEYEIGYLRFVEGYNLQQIASKLGYSYDHIRRMSTKCHKDATDNKARQ